MGLVEAVFGEFRDEAEDGVGDLRGDVVFRAATGDEAFPLEFHFFRILLAHGAAEEVRVAQRVARQHACGQLDLFLVDDYAVGLGADLFEKRVEVFDLLQALLTLDVIVDELHRAWAVERADGDDVLDRTDIEAFAAICDAPAFHLEHAQCLAAVVDVERGAVVSGNRRDIEAGIRRMDEAHGLLHDREGAQAQEVHL